MRIAFHAPLKPPDHPTPSGDRTMARALMSLLGSFGEVEVASRLRTRDGRGDPDFQEEALAEADAEIERLTRRRHDLWVTYHNYYKAPDLIGPAVARAQGIPYLIVEASRAPSRLVGPWARFARAAEDACDAADAIFWLTERDRPALELARPPGQRLVHLPPFLDRETLPPPKAVAAEPRLLAVGMMRAGDKLESYRALAAALGAGAPPLTVVGDGPERTAVEAMLPAGTRFLGALPQEQVLAEMRRASALVWPGVNEAFGMVYLEAQSVGLRCIAEDRPGVREVVGPTGRLVTPEEPEAFAAAIRALEPETHETVTETRAFVAARHLRPSARAIVGRVIRALA